MAKSTESEHRARLIREMSKDMNRTRHSSGSSRLSQGQASPEPTTSEFDPDNEAIMSTRQLDNQSQHLPELRTSARKYSRFTRPTEPDFAINTSAIGRAFPDFSQGGTSSDDDSLSIEIGRGAKKNSNGTIGKLGGSREYSSNAQLDFDGDSMDYSAPMVGNYEVTATPPLRQRRGLKSGNDEANAFPRQSKQTRKPSGLQKEVFDPSPPAKTKDYGSGESRNGSNQKRHTLAAMHARAQEEHDESGAGEERPPTVDLTVKNTRFGRSYNPPTASSAGLPAKFSSAQAFSGSALSSNKQNPQVVSAPNQGTQQSFMLPDLPNISELVSGVFEDGTPVFTRHGKSRASRFAATTQQTMKDRQDHLGVNAIPVPDDEQAIFLSLKLLQDKVAVLEKNNAEAGNTINELQQKNRILEAEKGHRKKVPRTDSALGTTDSEGDHNTGAEQRKLLIEKNRLESNARALQYQLDAAHRKSTTAETILRDITQERDSAVSQLGVAFVTIEQLKAENEALCEENMQFKARLGHSNGEKTLKDPNNSYKGLKPRIDQQDRNTTGRVNATPSLNHKQKVRNEPSKTHHLSRSSMPAQTPKASVADDANAMFDLSSGQNAKVSLDQEQKHGLQDAGYPDSEGSVYESPKRKGKGHAVAHPARDSEVTHTNGASRDLTYLSFLDNHEIAQLRMTLEQERIERNQRQNRKLNTLGADNTNTQRNLPKANQEVQRTDVPRKSSMKDLTTRSLQQKDTTNFLSRPDAQPDHARRHSETSILSTRSRRRGIETENMTSAFIVPDITIRNQEIHKNQVPELTKKNHEIINALAKHEERTCMVCRRKVNPDEIHDHGKTANEPVRIAKPVPVSERDLKTAEVEDPTIRPSQTPGQALAVVLKELEDELDHLKIDLAHYQALYNGHDPALSKRRRKSVQQLMTDLLRAIDVKADQIYSLYDVLEGQKQDGRELSEDEVEVTLQSIGMKAPELHLRGGGDEDYPDKTPFERQPWDLENEEGTSEDLPWEGIETTVETTKSGFARRSK